MSRCRDCRCEVPAGVLRCDYHAREHYRHLLARRQKCPGCDQSRAPGRRWCAWCVPQRSLYVKDYRGPSLTQELAVRGYTRHSTPTTITSGKRAIMREGGAEVVAELTAQEAWEWLRTGRNGP